MKPTFLISCAALFLGGVLMLIFTPIINSRVTLFLGGLFVLMGGIPVILCWFRELSALLPDGKKQEERTKNSNEEEK